MSNESEVSLQNANPVIYDVSSKKAVKESYEYIDENSTDAVDSEEIFGSNVICSKYFMNKI